MIRVLFVSDYYRGGDQENGRPDWELNIAKVLELSSQIIADFFYPDLCSPCSMEEKFKEALARDNFDFILFTFAAAPGSRKGILPLQLLSECKSSSRTPWVVLWGDLQIRRILRLAIELRQYFDGYLVSSTSVAQRFFPKNFCVQVPEPKRSDLFFPGKPWRERDYDVTFVGSIYRERKPIIRALSDSGLNVRVVESGSNMSVLSSEEYAELMRNSKICLSFSRSAGFHVINARAWEALSCGAVLLEQVGVETMRHFVPEREFLMFWSTDDLLNKINQVLSDESMAQALAVRGREAYCRAVGIGPAAASKQATFLGRDFDNNLEVIPSTEKIALWFRLYGFNRTLRLIFMWVTNHCRWLLVNWRVVSCRK